MKIRGFEKISTYKDIEFSLPTRKTTKSAGYDFYLPEDVELIAGKITLVPTGVKVYMQSNEYLGMHVRSSIALKKCVTMINNQGIIDADYYDNEDNEGHIMLPLFNLGNENVCLNKGERIAQGIFYSFLLADDDKETEKVFRSGGFGSTK